MGLFLLLFFIETTREISKSHPNFVIKQI